MTNGLKAVAYEFGAYLVDSELADYSTNTVWDGDIIEALSEYFGVTVTSFHTDDAEYSCIWVCYKED